MLFADNLQAWLTPLWLVGAGTLTGLVLLAIAYGVLRLAAPRAAAFAVERVSEGVLLPVLAVAALLAVVTVLGSLVAPAKALLSSVGRMASVGTTTQEIAIEPLTQDYKIPFAYRPGELRAIELVSDQPLVVLTRLARAGADGRVKLLAGQPFQWTRGKDPLEKPFNAEVTEWRALNLAPAEAHLQLRVTTDIEYAEVRLVPWVALGLVGLVGLYLLLEVAAPKIAAIALTTTKETMGQPLFYVALALGGFALLAFIYIPYNTFGEDVKMLKDSGLTLIKVLAIVVAMWSASVSVADEIEGRTALTLLSKPVARWQLILGKFVGLLWPVLLIFIVLGTLFLATVSYKVVYDARESAAESPTWQLCYVEIVRILPGLALAFMEAAVMAAISVALSTRLPMMANLVVCAAIYALGNLVPTLALSSVGKFEAVQFIAQLIGTVLPVLDHFNIYGAIAGGAEVPWTYLGWAFVYCLLYCSGAMLVALALFEDRDLA